jgi:hypothetical protein
MDDSFFLYEEMLTIELGKDPTFEEVDEYMTKRLTITKEEELRYQQEKIDELG